MLELPELSDAAADGLAQQGLDGRSGWKAGAGWRHPRQALTMVRVTTLDGWSELAEPIYDVSASMALFMVPRGRARFGVASLAPCCG